MSGHKIGWYVKILLSYLLLTGILVASIGIPVVREIRSLVRYEITDSAQRALEAANERLDDWLRTMEEYARQTKQDTQMSPYLLAQDGYYSMKARDELEKTVIYSGQYDAIALVFDRRYFSGEPFVYSSEGNVESSTFFTSFFRYEQWDCQDIYKDMQTLHTPALRAPEWLSIQRIQRAQYLTYVVPMGEGKSPGRRGVMLFLISLARFDQMMTGVSLPRSATLVLENPEGQVVYASKDEPLDLLLPFSLPQEGDACQVGSTSCLLLRDTERTGFRFSILLQQQVLTETLLSRLLHVLALLGAGVLFAIAASFVLTSFIYRPVRRLKAIARQLDGEPSNLSEFDRIEQTMTGLSRKNTDLLSQLHSQSASLRQHLLQAMCLGGVDQKDAFLSLVREGGISFDERSMRLAELCIDHPEQLAERMDATMRALTRYSLLKILREKVKGFGMSSIGCESGRENCVFALLSGRVEDEERVRAALQSVQAIAEENFSFTLTIGVSACFGSLEEISRHCRSASEAVEQRFLHGSGQLFFAPKDVAQDEPDEDARRHLTRQELHVLGELRAEHFGECIQAVDQYVQLIRELRLSPGWARHQMLLLRSSIDQQLRLQCGCSQARQMSGDSSYETMDLMQDAIAASLRDLDKLRSGAGGGRYSELVERCVAYIQEHLADQDLTMEALAGALDVSSGHLSKCFKLQVGVTPWQYIDALRMQRACQLLKDTNLRINGILQACGYVDKTNFMRKFKRQYDMTPIEYRQANGVYPADDASDSPEDET